MVPPVVGVVPAVRVRIALTRLWMTLLTLLPAPRVPLTSVRLMAQVRLAVRPKTLVSPGISVRRDLVLCVLLRLVKKLDVSPIRPLRVPSRMLIVCLKLVIVVRPVPSVVPENRPDYAMNRRAPTRLHTLVSSRTWKGGHGMVKTVLSPAYRNTGDLFLQVTDLRTMKSLIWFWITFGTL